MANYNKSFNLRNGVQVDNDRFFVNANGLVGIGTSVPTEILDVRGNARISGFVTTTSIFAQNLSVNGVGTITTLRAGIVTAISGIVTYYGDGSKLSNIPTSQWVSVDVGLGFTSIYNSGTGYVGVSTNDPRYTFQVGGNPNSQSGVGFNATGNIKATGIITAASFSGDGASLTALSASNISSGTLSNSRLPSSISVSAVTATTFSGSLTGTASTASSLTGSPNITVSNVTASNITLSGNISASNANLSGVATASSINATNIISGISSVGVSTVSTRLYAESIGVGTNSPESDIHVRRTSTSKLQITSDSAEAIVAVGRSTTLAGSNGALRFGNTSGLQRYSSTKSLDIVNYDTGNINSYLQLGSTGINTGSFYWFYGQTVPNTPLMTLTYGGNLGLGVTNPTEKLKVVGVASITSSLYVDQNIIGGSSLTVNNNITATTGSITAGSNLTVSGTTTLNGNTTIANSGNLTVTGNLVVNGSFNIPPINQTSGISTFFDVIVSSRLGIGTNSYRGNAALDILDESAIIGGIGIGTTDPNCAVDFSNAGKNIDISGSFMLPPKLTSSERVGLATVEGALIYNTTVRRLELYLGTGRGWVGIVTTT